MKLCVAIVGPTSSGKSSLGISLAKVLKGEILCMDSTTVYRGFDIGSAKPSKEEQTEIPHHLLDLLDPMDAFSAFHFVEKAGEVLGEISKRKKLPIIVGGTYFYLRALQNGMFPATVVPNDVIESIEAEFFEDEQLNTHKMHAFLKQLDPKSAERIHPNDKYRLIRALAILRTSDTLPSELKAEPRSSKYSQTHFMKYAIAVPRHRLDQLISSRTQKMIDGGLVEETRALRAKFPQSRALSSVGYSEACMVLDKKITEKQLRNEIITKTRQLAKRQLCWIRSDPQIRFVTHHDLNQMKLEIENLQVAMGEQV